jgi:hypothetical protein
LNAAAASALSITIKSSACLFIACPRAQHAAINLVAFEVHRRAFDAFDAYLDAGRFCEVIEDIGRLALAKLSAVEINALTPRSAARVSAWITGQSVST